MSAKEQIGLLSVPEYASLFFTFDVKIWLSGLKLCQTFLKGAPGPGSKYGPQRWEASVLTTANEPSPLLAFIY